MPGQVSSLEFARILFFTEKAFGRKPTSKPAPFLLPSHSVTTGTNDGTPWERFLRAASAFFVAFKIFGFRLFDQLRIR